MKNFILSAAILAFAGVSTVKANVISPATSIITQADNFAKVPVKLEELPDSVKATLKADAYKDWTPTGAFIITDTDKSTFYQIDVKKGSEVAYLQLSKEGKSVQ